MLEVPRSLPTLQWHNWLVTISTLYSLLSSACSRCVASWSDTLLFFFSSGMCKAGSARYVAPRVVFPLLVGRPAARSWPRSRRRQWWQYTAGFACDGAHRVSLQVLGGAAGAVLAVMDVAVFTQLQFVVSRTVEVPQTQFIAPSEDTPDAQQRRVRTVQLCRAGLLADLVVAMRGSLKQFCCIFGLRPLAVEAQGGEDAGSLCHHAAMWHGQTRQISNTSAPPPPTTTIPTHHHSTHELCVNPQEFFRCSSQLKISSCPLRHPSDKRAARGTRHLET